MLSFGRPIQRSEENRAVATRVSNWLIDHCCRKCSFLDPSEIQVMTTEIQCFDPGCVPLETLIVIFVVSDIEDVIGPSRFSEKILKPMDKVLESDIAGIDFPFRFYDSEYDLAVKAIERSFSSSTDKNPKAIRMFERYVGKITAIKAVTVIQNEAISTIPRELPIVSTASAIVSPKTVSHPVTQVSMTPVKVPMQFNETNPKTVSKITDEIPVPTSRSYIFPVKKEEDKVIVRHNKEEKRRGCPCCDPDNLDHLLDKIMFMEYPPS